MKKGFGIVDVLLVVLIIFTIFMIILTGVKDSRKAKNLPEVCNRDFCCGDCMKLGFKHLKSDNSGFGSQECWCIKDGTPIQIY